MRIIVYVCFFCLLILTACGNNQEIKSKSDGNKNIEQVSLYENDELIESIKELIKSDVFKKYNNDEKNLKLEEVLNGYVESGEILDYKLSIKTDRPCFSVTFKDGRKDIFLLEDFPKDENR